MKLAILQGSYLSRKLIAKVSITPALAHPIWGLTTLNGPVPQVEPMTYSSQVPVQKPLDKDTSYSSLMD